MTPLSDNAGGETQTVVPAAGVDFYTQKRGEGSHTLFLHGFAGDLHTWDRMFTYLNPGLLTLRYDLRGFGLTQCRDDKPFRHGDDLRALMDACSIPQCNVIGVSMGGAVALNFALNYPQRVNSLVLISPSLVAWEWSEIWQQQWRVLVDTARAGNLAEAKQRFYQHPLFTSTRHSESAQDFYDSVMAYSGQQWLHDSEKASLPDVDRLSELSVRTLLLSVGQDLEEFKVMANLLEACANDLTRVNFVDQGHLLHLENPSGCAAAINSFLYDQM